MRPLIKVDAFSFRRFCSGGMFLIKRTLFRRSIVYSITLLLIIMQTYRLLLPADSEYSTLSLRDGRQAIDIRSATMPRTIILASDEYGIEQQSQYESDDRETSRSSLRPSGSQSPRRSYQKNVSFNKELEESTPQEPPMSLSPRRSLQPSSRKQMTADDIRSIASGNMIPPKGLSRKTKTRPAINSSSGLPTFPDPNSPRDIEADRASGEEQLFPRVLNFDEDMSSRRSGINGRSLSSTRGISESSNSMVEKELTQSSRTRPRSSSRGDEGGILPAMSMRSNQSESTKSTGGSLSPRDSMKSDKNPSSRSMGSSMTSQSSNSSTKSMSNRMSSRK